MPVQLLTALPHSLRTITDDPLPNDRALRSAAINLRIPAHQINGRWHFSTDDLPKIAAALGLSPKAASAPVGARARSRKAAQQVAA